MLAVAGRGVVDQSGGVGHDHHQVIRRRGTGHVGEIVVAQRELVREAPVVRDVALRKLDTRRGPVPRQPCRVAMVGVVWRRIRARGQRHAVSTWVGAEVVVVAVVLFEDDHDVFDGARVRAHVCSTILLGAVRGSRAVHPHQEYWQSDGDRPAGGDVGGDPVFTTFRAHAHGAGRGAARPGDHGTQATDHAHVAMDRVRAGHRVAPVGDERGRQGCRAGARLRGDAAHKRRRHDAVRTRPHHHVLDVPARLDCGGDQLSQVVRAA